MAREISEGCNGWWKDAHHNPPTKSGSLYLPRLPSFYWVVVRNKYFYFHPYLGKISNFFNWVETTNLIQTCLCLPLLFPTLPNGGQVGDIGKVWCSLFSMGREVVASRGRCFFPNRPLLFLSWKMLTFNSFFCFWEFISERLCVLFTFLKGREASAVKHIVTADGNSSGFPPRFLLPESWNLWCEWILMCVCRPKNIMGIVEKISSCVLNMDSSGRGGWVVKIALGWLSQEVIKVGFMLHPATENCWWICWPPNMVNRIGVTVAYAICVQAYFSVLRVSIAILLRGERNHGKRCEIRCALGRLGCLQGRDWDFTCI